MSTVDFDPRKRAAERLGALGDSLAADTLTVGVSAARAIQHQLFPDEFEYYALTLELVDSIDRTVDYLTFPVMPDSLSYDDLKVAHISKTLGGVNATDSETFTPKTINIQGNFGKRFKLLIMPFDIDIREGAASRYDGFKGVTKRKAKFNNKMKTGYGAVKILERIMTKASQLDEKDEPHKLYLYIPPLGHNFLVKCTQFALNQDKQSSNMIWNYNMQLTAIAPLDVIMSEKSLRKSLQRNLTIDNLQKLGTSTANTTVQSLRRLSTTTKRLR